MLEEILLSLCRNLSLSEYEANNVCQLFGNTRDPCTSKSVFVIEL